MLGRLWVNEIPRAAATKHYKLGGLNQGSLTPGPRTGTGPQPVTEPAAQQEVSGGRASGASSASPHRSPSLALPPEPPPTPSVEKLSSMKPVPGAKKVGDRWLKQQKLIVSQLWRLDV